MTTSHNTNPVPFAEPPWLLGLPSPYYNESHRKWQRTCRDFIDEHLTQHAVEWEKAETVPEHVFGEFAKAGMLVPSLPAPLPVEWLKRLGIHELRGGLKVEDFDYMHQTIYVTEMVRSGLQGPAASLNGGLAFGIPPLLKFGSHQLQERFIPDLLLGKKRLCIAITEPDAGSDVANIQTVAKKTTDGRFYVVDGTKKWITNGIWSDYATTTVRTGGPGPRGLSLLLVPLKNQPGVSMRRLKVGGHISAGTTYIELDDVKVPAENLIGEEGRGMSYVMTNFNHERLYLAVGATAQARAALGRAFTYTTQRHAFSRRLVDQPVVRHRLARAGAELESLWAWIESLAHQMSRLPKKEADARLGGLTALAKARAGMVLQTCAECAMLLFGGNGYTRSGLGEVVEMLWREAPGVRIPGGSEDVMLDLAVRQLLKNYERASKDLGDAAKRSKL